MSDIEISNNAKKLSHKDALEKIYNIIKEKTNVK